MSRTFLILIFLGILISAALGSELPTLQAPITGPAGQVMATDHYWISFGGDSNGDSYFLMQINSAGNVTKPPKAVIPCARIGACQVAGATALSKNGTTKLNYWVFGAEVLYRVVLDKGSLAAVGQKKFNLVTNDDDGLQITQRPLGNFIVLEQAPHILKGHAVTPLGLGVASWSISPLAPAANDEGSVSA